MNNNNNNNMNVIKEYISKLIIINKISYIKLLSYINEIRIRIQRFGRLKSIGLTIILYLIYRYYQRQRKELIRSHLEAEDEMDDEVDDQYDSIEKENISDNIPLSPTYNRQKDSSLQHIVDYSQKTRRHTKQRNSKLINFLVQTEFVGSLGMAVYSKLVPLMNTISIKRGEYLFDSNNKEITSLFIIRNGRLGVFIEDSSKILSVYVRGQSLGEFGLLSNCNCDGIGIIALDDSEVFELKRDVFDNFSALYARETVTFLDTTIAGQWRVAAYALEHFIKIPLASREGSQGAASLAKLNFSTCGITDSFHDHNNGGCIPKSILDCSSIIHLRRGEELFCKGDPATSLYIVENGKLHALTDDGEIVGLLSIGFIVGGISFFGGTDRGETIMAAEDTIVHQLTKLNFRRLIEQSPNDALKIAKTVGTQLSPVLFEFFQYGLQTSWFHSGHLIFREGDLADSLYVIISGRVRAYSNIDKKKDSNDYERIFDCGRGEIIGASNILLPLKSDHRKKRRRYTAVAVRDTRVIRLSRNCFLNILKKFPEVMVNFTQTLAKQMQILNERLIQSQRRLQRPNIATIALIPIGSNRRSLGPFATRLANALSKLGSTLHLSSERFEQLFRHGSSLKLDDTYYAERASHWIMEQEENNKFLIFEGDGGSDITPWNKCCVRHADCVVLVGRASNINHRVSHQEEVLLWADNPKQTLDPLWQSVRQEELHRGKISNLNNFDDHNVANPSIYKDTHKILVLLHSDPSSDYKPRGTKKWFKGRNVRSFHHIRLNNERDFGRLARHLAGESVAVVLSGGGARGLAHLGALQAIEEAGIPIDIVGGTSQGSFMAAAYSMTGGKFKLMRKYVQELVALFTPWAIIKGFMSNFPWTISYFSGRELSDTLFSIFGHRRIEDLWLPYFCVVTNMSQLDQEIKQTGILWRMIRSSMSVLPFLPPCTNEKNELLIDGGYVNNLPVDVMCETWQPALVIAVDVEDKDFSQLQNVHNYGEAISSFSYLWNTYIRRRVMYRVGELMIWLSCINHTRQLRHVMDDLNLIDIYIRPQVQKYGLLDYQKVGELAALGYIEAKNALNKWQAKLDKDARDNSYPRSPGNRLHRTTSTQLARNLSAKALSDRIKQDDTILHRRHSLVNLHTLS